MKWVLLLIVSLFAVCNIYGYQVPSDNLSIFPEDEIIEVEPNEIVKIEVSFRDEDDDLVCVNREDSPVKELKCIQNNVTTLFSYVSSEGKFCCIYDYGCDASESTIDVLMGDDVIKTYDIEPKTASD